MKKSQELSRKTWKMIAKNLIILAVLAAVAFVGVSSWFTSSTTAKANGAKVTCKAPEGVEIAIVAPGASQPAADSTEWKKGSVNLTASAYPFLKDLFLCEVTGDGKSFSSPVLAQSDGMAYVDTESDWSLAVANEDYISFDLYMRSKTEQEVLLTESTEIAPVSELTSGSEYSPDTAVGAVRFSVVDTGSNRKLLWIPAPNVYYDGAKDEVETGITDKNNNKGVSYNEQTYNDGTYNHAYYTTTKQRNVLKSSGSGAAVTVNNACDYTLGTAVSMAVLSTKSDGYYVNHVRCNLWIEGEDAEARLAMVGGKFKMTLDLALKK